MRRSQSWKKDSKMEAREVQRGLLRRRRRWAARLSSLLSWRTASQRWLGMRCGDKRREMSSLREASDASMGWSWSIRFSRSRWSEVDGEQEQGGEEVGGMGALV